MLFGGNQRLFAEARARGMAISIDVNWDPRWGVAPAEEIRADGRDGDEAEMGRVAQLRVGGRRTASGVQPAAGCAGLCGQL